MAQENVVSRVSRTRIGRESTFGTAATNMRDLVIVDPDKTIPLGESARAMLPNGDQRRYRSDIATPIHGLQSKSPVKFAVLAKQIATRLNASATPVAASNASALSHQVLLEHWLGGETTPAAGSAVVSSTASTITVTTSQGSRFVVGQWIIVESSVTAGFEVRFVTAVATDTLTVWPNFAGTPTASGEVRNVYQYHRAESHSLSFTLEHAFVEGGTVNTQRRGRGCYGACEVSTEIGQVPRFEFSGLCTAHTNPGDISLTLAASADDMGSPLVWLPTVLFQPIATTTSTAYNCEKLSFKMPNKWREQMDGSGLEGVVAVRNVGGREERVEWEAEMLFDAAEWTNFDADTARHLVAFSQTGTTTGARFFGLHIPAAIIDTEPVVKDVGGLLLVTLKGYGDIDTSITATPTPGTTADVQVSPVRIFLG